MLLKSISLLSIILSCLISYSQNWVDHLNFKKLSYHVVGLAENEPKVGGTGFFVKSKEKYFFVSALHCITFKNHLTEEYIDPNNSKINNLLIYRNLTDIRTDNFLRFDTKLIDNKTVDVLTKRINDTLIDIGAIEIQLTTSFKFDYINIEDHEFKELNNDDTLIYYGFPIINGHQVDTPQIFYGKPLSVSNRRGEFIINIQGYIGCSGSPVFAIKNRQVYLVGILFYALKDEIGKASLCKALNSNQLKLMLPFKN